MLDVCAFTFFGAVHLVLLIKRHFRTFLVNLFLHQVPLFQQKLQLLSTVYVNSRLFLELLRNPIHFALHGFGCLNIIIRDNWLL